jgi:predicted DNA-binding protein (MmcQ/YjbR family)
MNIEELRNFCLSLKGADEALPFDDNTLVFRVGGKIFAMADIDAFESINLKCEPELAIDLRDRYPAVLPGYHMNKKHWNTVLNNGSINDTLLKKWILDSYMLVVTNLSKKQRKQLDLD